MRRQLRARTINLNGKGNGARSTRQLLRAGTLAWLDQVGEIISDDYPRHVGFRAADRSGQTLIEVDIIEGDIIIEWETKMSNYRSDGRAALNAARYVLDSVHAGEYKIAWNGDAGLSARRLGDRGVVVRDLAGAEIARAD